MQIRIAFSYLQIDAILKWLYINIGSACSGLLLCNHFDFPISVIPYLPLGDPSEIITRGRLWRHPHFLIILRGIQILQIFQGRAILTRTNVADENLKVSTAPSDDFDLLGTKPVMLI